MIVSNTTPLSNFLHLARMDILRRLFSEIHIPHAVKQEIEEFFHANEQWRSCLDDRFIRVHHGRSSFLLNHPLHILHQGEVEALGLYLDQQARLCLIDDKDARVIAALHHINMTGTLGLLIEAKKKGLISAVKPLMDSLREQRAFWVSGKMYQHVLGVAGEESI